MKKIVALLLVVVAVFSVSACGLLSGLSILGKWESEEGYIRGDYGRLDDLEFFEDKTYTSSDSNYAGNYSISGGRLKLQGILASTVTYTFKVKGDTLTFYDDDGELLATYKRVEKK